MFVSCLCPTFPRGQTTIALLEEAIESWLRQDYPRNKSELIVLNDCPQQILLCDAPGVMVVNLSRRFNSLGEKYNAMVGLAKGSLLCPWEDDDISLPWRISLSVKKLMGQHADYYTPKRYWYHDGQLHHKHAMGVGHSCSIFSRKAWLKVGGYRPISGAQDMQMDNDLARAVKMAGGPALPLHQWYYIMRWHTGSHHLSGRIDSDTFYKEVGDEPIANTEITLLPHWATDYIAETTQAALAGV